MTGVTGVGVRVGLSRGAKVGVGKSVGAGTKVPSGLFIHGDQVS